MMKYYSADDFNGRATTSDTLAETIEKKIHLLKDFGFLKRNDEREPVVRTIFARCKTANEIDNILKNVVRFNETLDEFIARKGV